MTPLNHKGAVVTGSSRGIGARVARALAEAGARVVVNYSGNQGAADAAVADIRAAGGEAAAVRADVGKAEDGRALFDEAEQRFGRVHILVNNTGVAVYRRLEDTPDQDFDRVFGVNVRGVFNTQREAARRLADGGRVINFSSSVTRLLLPTYGTYAASKAAVEQLTRVFAKEVGPRGITVNAVSPGPTNTELFAEGKSEEAVQRLTAMSALGRLGEPEDIARVVVFLASDAAAWVSGQNLGVNGGFA
jgi:3-oxoacyl-[acyl-carrier protein] reductase